MSRAVAYVYAGNRSTVLRRMFDLGLMIKHILPTRGSWLEREAAAFGIPVTVVGSKTQAVEILQSLDFDVFVSTGFPYILPVSKLRQHHPDAKFVNIHPSYLPDLRGADPIPAAVLFRKDSGVTCHLMDDEIDTGPIICQQKIRYYDGLDAKLLYNLCFQLEPSVFEEALCSGFSPSVQSPSTSLDTVYYSFKNMDSEFNPNDDDNEFVSRIRAFNTPRKGFCFTVKGASYRAFEGAVISEESVLRLFNPARCNEVVAICEDAILIMRHRALIRLSYVDPRPTAELIGCLIGC